MSLLRYPSLAQAMNAVRNERAQEVPDTFEDLVETYGLAILFAEVASIVSRLKAMIWEENTQSINFDRLYDLLIDLGNFTDFLYMEAQKQEKREEINPNPELNDQIKSDLGLPE